MMDDGLDPEINVALELEKIREEVVSLNEGRAQFEDKLLAVLNRIEQHLSGIAGDVAIKVWNSGN